VEADPALAAAVHGALEESGLLTLAGTLIPSGSPAVATTATRRRAGRRRRSPRDTAAPSGDGVPALDPFVLYREHGETALRAGLETLDLAALRAIVRTHRLDPARISARWTLADRLIGLIIQQVQAHAISGRAFARV
jgi:hypothetical protein